MKVSGEIVLDALGPACLPLEHPLRSLGCFRVVVGQKNRGRNSFDIMVKKLRGSSYFRTCCWMGGSLLELSTCVLALPVDPV